MKRWPLSTKLTVWSMLLVGIAVVSCAIGTGFYLKRAQTDMLDTELKGEAKFSSPGVAHYKSYSDPCAIDFSFGSGGITLKEQGGCGVHRDIKCFFEGYYERRSKESKVKPSAKKT